MKFLVVPVFGESGRMFVLEFGFYVGKVWLLMKQFHRYLIYFKNLQNMNSVNLKLKRNFFFYQFLRILQFKNYQFDRLEFPSTRSVREKKPAHLVQVN